MHNQTQTHENAYLGFWIYLMTDLLMFAGLFAAFAVLRGSTFGGPDGRELFNMRFVLTETLILLTSSFTCGLAMVAVHGKNKSAVVGWLIVTFCLGLAFLGMEFTEFSKLVHEGNSWRRSAFLSSYFGLVGTHGLHIAVGLFWLLVSMVQIYYRGLSDSVNSKLIRFSLFWHFLDIVWIFIFTIVYLMGVI